MMDQVLTGKLTFDSLGPCDLCDTSKSEIRQYFENSYDINESLFSSLKDESVFYKCPDRLRLPLIFYYGHTACVYVNKMILADLIQPEDRVDLSLEIMMEMGVDEMSWDDLENYRMGGKFQWPPLDKVITYRRRVRQLIIDVIKKTPLELPITMGSPWWGLIMGIEHERIHIETSAVLLRQLPVCMVEKPLCFVYGPMQGAAPVKDNPFISVSATAVTLGKPEDSRSYGWDNEYGRLECKVPEFSASKYMVTNREFYEFVKAGGYETMEFWTDEGWKWKNFCECTHPIFWVCDKGCKTRCGDNLNAYTHCVPAGAHNAESNGMKEHIIHPNNRARSNAFRYRCMFDVLPMTWNWPVEVSYHEAKAFTKWKGSGYRLPTEAEHKAIRKDAEEAIYEKEYESRNYNLLYGSSTPVNLLLPTPSGFHDVLGNAWEWLEDHVNGFPGFKPFPLYDDFSYPFFDGRHNVMLGGSWVTTGSSMSPFYRVGFRRHFMQFCGFRLVKSTGPAPVCVVNNGFPELSPLVKDVVSEPMVPIHYKQDTSEMAQRQLILEYGDESTWTVCILKQLTLWLKQYGTDKKRFLHLGCGAGNLSSGLATLCEELLALDISGNLIDLCVRLKSGKPITLEVTEDMKDITTPPLRNAQNINFKQFLFLPNEVGCVDSVISTLFDRIDNIEYWTLRLREIVRNGGLLVVLSTDKWTEHNLSPYLSKHFCLLEASDIVVKYRPMIRASIWRRHSRTQQKASSDVSFI